MREKNTRRWVSLACQRTVAERFAHFRERRKIRLFSASASLRLLMLLPLLRSEKEHYYIIPVLITARNGREMQAQSTANHYRLWRTPISYDTHPIRTPYSRPNRCASSRRFQGDRRTAELSEADFRFEGKLAQPWSDHFSNSISRCKPNRRLDWSCKACVRVNNFK